MTKYRTFEQLSEDYFKLHPEEIDDFLSENFAEYAKDGDSVALLSALRIIASVKGISVLAEEVGMNDQNLQKVLSSKGNPRLDNISAIMQSMGYKLMPQKINMS